MNPRPVARPARPDNGLQTTDLPPTAPGPIWPTTRATTAFVSIEGPTPLLQRANARTGAGLPAESARTDPARERYRPMKGIRALGWWG